MKRDDWYAKLPKEVSRGTITLFGCQLDVINLDNGQRIIDREDFERLMRVTADGGLDLKNITPADFGDGSEAPDPSQWRPE